MFFLALLKRVNLKIVNYFKIHFLFEYKNILHRVRHTSVKDLITSVCWTFMWLEKDDMKQIFCVHAPWTDWIFFLGGGDKKTISGWTIQHIDSEQYTAAVTTVKRGCHK